MKRNLTVVKIGGNVINDPHKLESFLKDFSGMEGMKILVHGGGKKATEMAADLGLKTQMIGGRRVTDAKGLEVVIMVYAGLLNKNIVAKLQAADCNAIGLSGADADLIRAHKRKVGDIDYGFAGDVDAVDDRTLGLFLDQGIVPVFSAITHDKKGQLLNTNADTIASELAKGLAAAFEVELIYCFEKKGVLKEIEDQDSVIEKIDTSDYSKLKADQVIVDGMLPKLDNCFDALQSGVQTVLIGLPELIGDRSLIHTRLTL